MGKVLSENIQHRFVKRYFVNGLFCAALNDQFALTILAPIVSEIVRQHIHRIRANSPITRTARTGQAFEIVAVLVETSVITVVTVDRRTGQNHPIVPSPRRLRTAIDKRRLPIAVIAPPTIGVANRTEKHVFDQRNARTKSRCL